MKKLISAILISSVIGCSHVTYTPEESAKRIEELEQTVKKLKELSQSCEKDLDECMQHLQDCQPLINPQ